MVFEDFENLEEIHHSVGKLERLTYMKISECPSLRSLPKELCFARALRELIVTESKIEEVPESIGRLESLTTLNLCYNKFRRLPASICDLENLLMLDVRHNPLDEGIPDEIGSLSGLEDLNLSYSKICFLPATIRQLTSLKSLNLGNCEMLQDLRGLPTSLTVLDASYCPLEEGIPEEIGNLSALEELDLSYSKIHFLPAGVRQITSLKSIKLRHCGMLQELRGLPTSLTVLDASYCPLEEGIPEEIGSLSALEKLDLSYGKIRFLPATVEHLTNLKSLKLEHCEILQEVRGLRTSLTVLDASYCPLEEGIPEEIGNLSALEKLDLSYSKICFLPATVSQLTSLKSLILHHCGMLQELRGLPTSLTELAFSSGTVGHTGEMYCIQEFGKDTRGWRSIKFRGAFELSFLSGLKTLGLSFPTMASEQTFLEIREFTMTEMELGGLDSLPSLTLLSIEESESLLRVSNIGRLRGLKSLRFRGCPALVEIPGLEQLEMLMELVIDSCDSICGVQDLLSLKRLKSVDISFCSSWLRVPRMIDECRLSIYYCGKLRLFRGAYDEYVRRREQEGQQNQIGR